tara:strand:+ start:2586 stop:2717 length:132 start_codon:yes stop_codon:yes gene_type:complete
MGPPTEDQSGLWLSPWGKSKLELIENNILFFCVVPAAILSPTQ